MTDFRRTLLWLLLAPVLLQLQGCATQKLVQAAPAQQQPISVQVSVEDLSRWKDLPVGVYRVPDSQVVISGHQKGIKTAALLGSLVGLAIAHQANASAGASRVHDVEGALKIKLNDQLMADVGDAIRAGGAGKAFTEAGGAGPTLSLTPALIMTYVSDTEIRPFVLIRADLMDARGEVVWKSRYYASSVSPRPLAGAGSWTENDDAALRDEIQTSLNEAVRVMLADIGGPLARNEVDQVAVQGNVPFIRERALAVGYKLSEDARYLVVAVRVAYASVLSGVQIFDKSAITYRPATKDDKTEVLAATPL